MKFVQIALLGLVGESAALAKATDADDCQAASSVTQKCNGGTQFDESTGTPNECSRTMRGQTTSKSMFINNDTYGVWKTGALQTAGKGSIC